MALWMTYCDTPNAYVVQRTPHLVHDAHRATCGTSQYSLVGNGVLVRADAILTSAPQVLSPPSEEIWIGGYSTVRDCTLLLWCICTFACIFTVCIICVLALLKERARAFIQDRPCEWFRMPVASIVATAVHPEFVLTPRNNTYNMGIIFFNESLPVSPAVFANASRTYTTSEAGWCRE